MLERNDVYWQCGEKETLNDRFGCQSPQSDQGTVIPCRDCPQDRHHGTCRDCCSGGFLHGFSLCSCSCSCCNDACCTICQGCGLAHTCPHVCFISSCYLNSSGGWGYSGAFSQVLRAVGAWWVA